VNMLATRELLLEFCKEFEKLNLGWVSSTEVITMEVDSTLEQDIRKGQLEDAKIQEIKEQIKEEKAPGFSVIRKECYGTRGAYVFLMKRNQRVDLA
jgi:glutathione synthase/RimK-type ligase-like ATP-grasp enzyme